MIDTLQTKWNLFTKSGTGKKIIRAIRVLLIVIILSYLGYKLIQLGWRNILDGLPTQPLFYVFFLLLYFSIPLTEIYIYHQFWDFDSLKSLPVFIKKRILNTDVLGYSGEVYFFSWAHKIIDHSEIEIAKTIRDNNIISSAASTTITIFLLFLFLQTGHTRITDYIEKLDYRYLIIAGIIVIIVIPLLLRFRQYIFSTPLKKSSYIYGIQLGRMVLGQIIQIALWSIVLPSVPLSTWITYAALAILIARIPFPSNKQLIFMGVGIEVASKLNIPEVAMFSLLGTIVALNKIFNLILYFLLSVFSRNEQALSGRQFKITKREIGNSDDQHHYIKSDSG